MTDEQGTPRDEGARQRDPGLDAPTEADLAARLAADEQQLAAEERSIRRTRWLAAAIGAVLVFTIAALVVGMLALNRDIESVAKAEPKDASVDTASIQDQAVTADKLAPGAVGTDALADGAVTATKLAQASVTTDAIAPQAVVNASLAPASVGTGKLVDGAVTGRKAGENTLTGDNIDEATLAEVPLAASAQQATAADDAAALGGIGAASYLASVAYAQAATDSTLQPIQGPITATCPDGTRVIAGGAAIEGSDGVALIANGPDGDAGWAAAAQAFAEPSGPWRIVVTAICARGGTAAG